VHCSTRYHDWTLFAADDVDAVLVSADTFGGAAVISLAARPEILVVVVTSNTATMRVAPQAVVVPPSKVL
jgi:hypothetical protein